MNGHMEILKWARSQGCPEPDSYSESESSDSSSEFESIDSSSESESIDSSSES